MLLCSHEFGRRQYAEGICTWRLARALAEQGCRLRVATSMAAETGEGTAAMEVVRLAEKPGTIRVSMWLWRYFRYCLEPGLTWRYRVAHLPLGAESVVYGRSLPLSSTLAAAALARRHRKPFGVHFSDPFPGVWDARDPLYAARLRLARRLLRRADFVTFVTEQARRWVEQEQHLDLRAKSFVLPHVAPEFRELGPPPERPTVFLYAGRFYGRRRPERLLEGFRRRLRDTPGIEFHVVGADPESVEPVAARLGIGAAVKVFPFTLDLTPHLRSAHVLVATDADDRPAVFLTTKLIEYLYTDRKVLLVSPADSPGADLARRCPETVRHVAEDTEAIAAAMRELLGLSPSPEGFAQRPQLLGEFSGPRVAQRLLVEIQRRLGVDLRQRVPPQPASLTERPK